MNDNGKNLLDMITNLDPELIESADKKPRVRSNLLLGVTSGMATLAAAALIAVGVSHTRTNAPPVVDPNGSVSSSETGDSSTVDSNSGTSSDQDFAADPPVLDFSDYSYLPVISFKEQVVLGAMGGGTLESLHSSELDFSSPWKGAKLETMPVYMSCSTEMPDFDRMYARVKEIAAVLGISEDKLTFTDSDSYEDMTKTIEQQRKYAEQAGATPEEIEELIDHILRYMYSATAVEAKADGISIFVNSAYGVHIRFSDPVDLPGSYNFDNSASAEERNAALGYLADRYKELTGYSNSLPGQYSFFGNCIYEADGGITEQIANYWIKTTQFAVDEKNSKLDVIWIYSDGALRKIDDYPILTAAQAEAILKSNKYDDDNRMPSDAKIMKTDIVYENLPGSTAVMPYYEFYVATDIEPEGDYDIICEVYKIAAVPEQFIDMETSDIHK